MGAGGLDGEVYFLVKVWWCRWSARRGHLTNPLSTTNYFNSRVYGKGKCYHQENHLHRVVMVLFMIEVEKGKEKGEELSGNLTGK